MVWLKYDELWHQNYSAVGRGPSEQLPCSSYPDENYPSHSSLSLTQALGNKGIVEADPSMQVLTPAHQSRIDWQTVTLRAPVKNWSIYPGENPWRSQQSSLDYSCVTNCIQQQHLCEPPPLRREEHDPHRTHESNQHSARSESDHSHLNEASLLHWLMR